MPSNFDSQAFEKALEKLSDLSRSLLHLSGFSSKAGLSFSYCMRKAAPDKKFRTHLKNIQEQENVSRHSQMRMNFILDNEIIQALQNLKAAFMTASGGLSDFLWEDAEFVFSTTKDDHAVDLYLNRLKTPSGKKIRIPIKFFKTPASFNILSCHADLNLEGPIQKYGITFTTNSEPYQVLAPSPEAAVAHFCTLSKKRPSDIKAVTQSLELTDVRNDAQKMMARMQPLAAL